MIHTPLLSDPLIEFFFCLGILTKYLLVPCQRSRSISPKTSFNIYNLEFLVVYYADSLF